MTGKEAGHVSHEVVPAVNPDAQEVAAGREREISKAGFLHSPAMKKFDLPSKRLLTIAAM